MHFLEFSSVFCHFSLQKVSADTSSKMSEEESKPTEFSLETLKTCFEACLGKDNVLYIDKYILGKSSEKRIIIANQSPLTMTLKIEIRA